MYNDQCESTVILEDQQMVNQYYIIKVRRLFFKKIRIRLYWGFILGDLTQISLPINAIYSGLNKGPLDLLYNDLPTELLRLQV